MSNQSRREVLRRQQEAKARAKRLNRMVMIGSGILAAVVIAIVTAVIVNQMSSAGSTVPPNATSARDGITVYPGKAAADAPKVEIFLDYQCPFCKQLEDLHGATIEELGASGQINLIYRTKTFLDGNLRNDSSFRAAVAASCADTVGAYPAYHDAVFASQPQEGVGYPSDQLRATFAATAGISGENLTKFQACYDSRATGNFVKAVEEMSSKAGVNSTPIIWVNGKPLDMNSAFSMTADQLKAALLSK